jgi:hypothetical protein
MGSGVLMTSIILAAALRLALAEDIIVEFLAGVARTCRTSLSPT